MNEEIKTSYFLEQVKIALQKTLCIDNLNMDITLDTHLVNGVGANGLSLSSIDYIEFLVLMEDQFDISFGFDTAIFTVQDIYDFVLKYKSGDLT